MARIKNTVVPVKGLEPLHSKEQQILSLSCLPFHHTGKLERMTGLEPANILLGRQTLWPIELHPHVKV